MSKKIRIMRTYHAVKIGGHEETFFDSSKGFDITLDDSLIVKIEHKGARAYTSLFNVPFWDFMDDAGAEEKKGPGRPKAKRDE